jgi:hypothetical protein
MGPQFFITPTSDGSRLTSFLAVLSLSDGFNNGPKKQERS